MATPIPSLSPLPEPPHFSLVLGGPLHQLLRRARLSGPALEFLRIRLVVISLLTWLPLAVLSAVEGNLFGGRNLPFVPDIESHVRFLVALPVLLIAELIVDGRTREVIVLFLQRRIIGPDDSPKFYAAVNSATRACNSAWLELALLVVVYTFGHWLWRSQVGLNAVTWYAAPDGKRLNLTLAGQWYVWVSVPIFQFVLLRWYMRIVIWFRMLWRVSRLNLRLLPTHPDRAGGIGFLGKGCYAFAPILFAQGALLAGLISSRIFYQGESLLSFKVTIISLLSFCLLVILGPLIMFTPRLIRTKRIGLYEYGTLATAYVVDFDQKWVRGGAGREGILGTPDIQSLSDLANSYSVVREMKPVPFILEDVIRLVLATALPILPLLLTMMPLEELLKRIIKIMF